MFLHKIDFLQIVFINKIKSILNKFTYDTQHLFGLLFSRNRKKTHTDQSILQFFYCQNEDDFQTFKNSSCKNIILQCVFYRYNLPRLMFFFPYSM